MKKIFLLLTLVFFVNITGCNANNVKQYDIIEEIKNKRTIFEVDNDNFDTIKFGKYYQNDIKGRNKEDIEWYILKKKDGVATLISKYILDYKIYNDDLNFVYFNETSLNRWLNNDFIREAQIDTSILSNRNGDYISLLGYSPEYCKYIYDETEEGKKKQKNENNAFIGQGTKYAERYFIDYDILPYETALKNAIKNFGLDERVETYGSFRGNYWTNHSNKSYYLDFVDKNGVIGSMGSKTNEDYIKCKSAYMFLGVRPVIYITYDNINNAIVKISNMDKYFSKDENGDYLINTLSFDKKYIINEDGDVIDINKDIENINTEEIIVGSWYRTRSKIWYYFENDRNTAKKGWHIDPRDNQTYYLDVDTGRMVVGYQIIDGNKYYFSEQNKSPNWYLSIENGEWESKGNDVKSYGSMYKNGVTPDGYNAGADGKIIEEDVNIININDIDIKKEKEYNEWLKEHGTELYGRTENIYEHKERVKREYGEFIYRDVIANIDKENHTIDGTDMQTKYGFYAFFDIDNDNNDEMLVTERLIGDIFDKYDATKKIKLDICASKIYKIINDKPTLLYNSTISKNEIKTYYAIENGEVLEMDIKNDELTLIIKGNGKEKKLSENKNGNQYTINGDKVSLEKFNEEISKIKIIDMYIYG